MCWAHCVWGAKDLGIIRMTRRLAGNPKSFPAPCILFIGGSLKFINDFFHHVSPHSNKATASHPLPWKQMLSIKNCKNLVNDVLKNGEKKTKTIQIPAIIDIPPLCNSLCEEIGLDKASMFYLVSERLRLQISHGLARQNQVWLGFGMRTLVWVLK